MNSITFSNPAVSRPEHAPGDFYQDPVTGKVFILAQIDGLDLALVCLNDGKSWNSPTLEIASALNRIDRREWIHPGPGAEFTIRHLR